MPQKRVIVVQSREDPIAEELTKRLLESSALILHTGKSWSDTTLQQHLTQGKAIDCDLVTLVCPAARNDDLSRRLLAHYPNLIIVRVDTESRAGQDTRLISVDLVQHVALDRTRFGFERLLGAMEYLIERHGVGGADRLVRYLVIDDADSLDGTRVRFLEVKPGSAVPDRKLPAPAITWLNAAISEYFTRYPLHDPEEGSFCVSRQRALTLLDTLEEASRESGPQGLGHLVKAAKEALVAFADDPANALEPLVRIKRRLGLTIEEILALLICLAPEVDLAYQLIFGHIHDDMSRRLATPGLVDALLTGHSPATAAASISALVDRQLVSADAAACPGADQALRPDPAIVQWMMIGGDALLEDPVVHAVTRAQVWPGKSFVCEPADQDDKAELSGYLSRGDAQKSWTVLGGSDPEGWRAVLEQAAAALGSGLLRVQLERFAPLDARARTDTALRVSRAARLMSWHVVIDCTTTPVDQGALSALVEAEHQPGTTSVLLISDTRIAAAVLPAGHWRSLFRGTPSLDTRGHRFAAVMKELQLVEADEDGAGTTPAAAARLAAAYPLGVEALDTAATLAASGFSNATSLDERRKVFAAACRKVAAPDLLLLAHRLEPIHDLDKVIVPEDRVALLNEIVANVLYSRTVLEQWGFGAQLPYGRGVTALFSGASGTGKTMAAQAIARRLGVDVFAVDLSRIVSKYIGETEKHLDAVFVDAERSGSVLLFDEADALFGKRSEVKDAHDRYANMEVAYLLQRMEAFGGLAILTTNHRQSLDPAFVRRLRFIVEFPKPDASARQKIWRLCVPETAPVAQDVDWRLLARFDLSGGVIRQITLRAAFLAAADAARNEEDQPPEIRMKHFIAALRSELVKLGMQTAERDLVDLERLRAMAEQKAAEQAAEQKAA